MVQVLLPCVAVNNYVIHIGLSVTRCVGEVDVHHTLEDSRSIPKAEGHHVVFPFTPRGAKCSFLSVLFLHWNLVKAFIQIQFCFAPPINVSKSSTRGMI